MQEQNDNASSPQPARRRPVAAASKKLPHISGRDIGKLLSLTFLALSLALAYIAAVKPLYTATASIFIDPRNRKVVSDEIVQGYATDITLVDSQVAILTSDSVLRRVVETLRLNDDPDYVWTIDPGPIAKLKSYFTKRSVALDPETLALNTLAQTVKVNRAQKTYVVNLEVTAGSPARAAQIAHTILKAYLDDQMAAKSEEAKRANALIDARLGELREQVRRAETLYDDYKRVNKLLTSEGGVVNEQLLTKLNAELATARAVTAEAKARYDQIVEVTKSPDDYATFPDAVRSTLIQKLRDQYAQVARREAALASQLQARHPQLIEVRSQLAEVKAQIDAELRRIALAAEGDYQIARNRELGIAAQIDKAKADVTQLNTAQIKARELEQDVATSRDLLRMFLQRAKETQELQFTSTPDARVITPPALPTRPSHPSVLIILALALLGGVGLGFAWAAVSDHFDDSIRTTAELGGVSGLANASAIPLLKGGSSLLLGRHRSVPKAAQFSKLLQALADTSGARDAVYRQSVLRYLGKLKVQSRPGRPLTVMIVSPRAGVGNTGTTLALAYAAALAGDRVLLVDATSVKPDLSKIFAKSLKPADFADLDSREKLQKIITLDPASGLSCLPIARADLRTWKTQQRRQLISHLNGLSQSFDLVLIDAGSILDDESPASLLPAAGRVVIAARAGVTRRAELAKALEILAPARERTDSLLTMSHDETI